MAKVTVSYFKARGLFRKCVGKRRGADGTVRPAIFWLGPDRRAAEDAAERIADDVLTQPGVLDAEGVWTPEGLATAEREIHIAKRCRTDLLAFAAQTIHQAALPPDAVAALAVPTVTRPQPAPAAAGPTLYGAIKRYTESMRGKPLSDKHRERAVQVVEVNLKSVRKDCPLAEVDFAWIDSLCDYFKGRPKNLKDGKRMAPAGVANVLRYLRLFFVWVDDTELGGWQAPRKLLKPFKVRVSDLMTPVEHRQASTIQQFDVPTLVKLYKAGTDRQRAILLASLFTGGTQQELAVMEKSEFDLVAGTLHHFRNKTAVEGRFWLPPELVTMLKADFANRPGDPLAFRTADGNSLVTFKDGRQTSDAVRQMWDDLREAAEVPDTLSFKYLRKFLGDWMQRHGGEAIGQVALSQRPTSVLAKHYTSSRDFATFNKLQRKLHKELTAAGMFNAASGMKTDKGQAQAA